MNRHWNLTVGDAFEFVRNGKSIKQDRDAGGLPITRIETIADGQIDIERVGYAGVELVGNEQWLLQEGDILFSHINSVQHVGKCAIYEGTPAQLIHGMNLLALRPSKSLHPRYALYALRQPAFRAQLLQFVNKAVNQASVSTTNLKGMPFSLPTLDEQRRIAAILDKADALRQKRKRAIALLDSLTQSIFLEMFGDLTQWPSVKFETLLLRKLRNGVSPSTEGTVQSKVLTLSAITGATFNSSAVKDGMFKSAPNGDQTVDRLDFMICRGNGNKSLVGKGAFPDRDMGDAAFPDTIIAGTIDARAVDRQYLQTIWNHPATRSQIEANARTTNGTFKVNQTILESILIPLPAMELQQAFSEKITAAHAARVKSAMFSGSTDNLFASLQHRAFAGQP